MVIGLKEWSLEKQSLSETLQGSESSAESVSIVRKEEGEDCEKGNRARRVRKMREHKGGECEGMWLLKLNL